MPEASNEDTAQLLQRGDSRGDLGEAVVPECAHPAVHRCPLELLAIRAGDGERLELLGHHEQLENADASAVASVVAPGASALAVERCAVGGSGDLGRDPVPQELV